MLTHRPSKIRMSLFLHQIWRNVSLHQCLSNGCSAVNGCRQNESLIKTSQHSSPSVNIWRRQKKRIQRLTLNHCFWLNYEFIIHNSSSSEEVFWSESGEKSADQEAFTRQNSSKHICGCILMREMTGDALFHWRKCYYGLWTSILKTS